VADVERWVSNGLFKSAPKLQVLSKEDAAKRVATAQPTSNLSDFIPSTDAVIRALSVMVGYGHDAPTGISWYSIRLNVERSGIIVGGIAPVSVWTRTYYGVFGSNAAVDLQLQVAVETLATEFARDWSKANP